MVRLFTASSHGFHSEQNKSFQLLCKDFQLTSDSACKWKMYFDLYANKLNFQNDIILFLVSFTGVSQRRLQEFSPFSLQDLFKSFNLLHNRLQLNKHIRYFTWNMRHFWSILTVEKMTYYF